MHMWQQREAEDLMIPLGFPLLLCVWFQVPRLL